MFTEKQITKVMITEFTNHMIAVTDRLLGHDLDPVQILYLKSEDLSISFEGYRTLMRAAHYLHCGITPVGDKEYERRMYISALSTDRIWMSSFNNPFLLGPR